MYYNINRIIYEFQNCLIEMISLFRLIFLIAYQSVHVVYTAGLYFKNVLFRVITQKVVNSHKWGGTRLKSDISAFIFHNLSVIIFNVKYYYFSLSFSQ